jgi:uncharacterized cupredoxin-like copper-binding protein
MTRRLQGLILAIAIGGALTACGDSSPTPVAGVTTVAGAESSTTAKAPAPRNVKVVAKDISLSAKEYSASAGAVHITYLNEGSIEHTLRIEGVDGFRLDVPTKGAKDAAAVDLAAGSYTIYCDIPGHRQAGMHATLDVR